MAYLAMFRIRFAQNLQYRTAAIAAIATQFAWAFLYLMMYSAFARTNPSAIPMSMPQLSSYVWLQQALLMLFSAWYWDREIFDDIISGNVIVHLCRPMDVYAMWIVRLVSYRMARALLGMLPVLLVAFLLPEGYRLSMPNSGIAFAQFLVSLVLSLLVVVTLTMIVYGLTFYTHSGVGLRTIATVLMNFLGGAVIPLPFFPLPIAQVLALLPFGSMQNTPLRIYVGDLQGTGAWFSILLQVAWCAILGISGYLLIYRSLRKLTVFGG